MIENCVLEVNDLSKEYKVRKGELINAVNQISFKAYEGEILGLLGPNGAGKTTTVKMICSLIKPTSGNVLINGVDNQEHRNKALKNISAVLEGNRNIYWRLTVRENLEFFASLKGINPKKIINRINHYIEFFDLKEKENELASKLSRGMQQKLAIATALVSGCDIILLDEPTLGLDVKASYDVRDLLKKIVKEEKKTIIITTHDMNVVQEVCDRVIIINNGNIITNDSTENLLELFKIKNYSFVIENILSNNIKNQLLEISHLEINEKDMETELFVNLEDSQIFYDVVDILATEKCIIKSIENKELNFEKVFVEIIGRSEDTDE
ncbi:ABC transporter ATP-binding protein [Mycoplasmatota bacterium WC44]